MLTLRGRFFPLGALTELGVPEVVHTVVEQAQIETSGRVLEAAWELTWDKVLHLIFLPLLAATRPWQLRYTLGSGLLGICQTAYRFETIPRVLGELAQAWVGTPLRYRLCRVWVETLVGPKLPLHLYIDVHLKPQWTPVFTPHLAVGAGMPCGHVATAYPRQSRQALHAPDPAPAALGRCRRDEPTGVCVGNSGPGRGGPPEA